MDMDNINYFSWSRISCRNIVLGSLFLDCDDLCLFIYGRGNIRRDLFYLRCCLIFCICGQLNPSSGNLKIISKFDFNFFNVLEMFSHWCIVSISQLVHCV